MVLASAKVGFYAVSHKWVLPGAGREGPFHGQRTRISKHLSKGRRCFQVLFQGLLARSSWSEVTFASPEKGNGGEELSPRVSQLISMRSSQFFPRQDKEQLFQPRPQGGLGIGHVTLSFMEDSQETPQSSSLPHIPQGQEVLPDVCVSSTPINHACKASSSSCCPCV